MSMLRAPPPPDLFYWVGQNVRSGFSIKSYRNTRTNFLAKLIFPGSSLRQSQLLFFDYAPVSLDLFSLSHEELNTTHHSKNDLIRPEEKE